MPHIKTRFVRTPSLLLPRLLCFQEMVSRNNKSLKVNGQEHEVTSYSVPNSEMCKGIIYIDRTQSSQLMSPYLPALTKAELHSVLASGFSTISGSVLATLVGLGRALRSSRRTTQSRTVETEATATRAFLRSFPGVLRTTRTLAASPFGTVCRRFGARVSKEIKRKKVERAIAAAIELETRIAFA
ncbi:hypothetical protein HPB50_026646 [Hyalomma asiaticum]|uniref:Uncharacterized protein n=1 Tax=Hyalomma asiaticum TaxID=266040 RepID=A0ACB7T2F2_HYAAI|nr:hypothetical protein HPB50_026646 [Hyalomma asiaticum]